MGVFVIVPVHYAQEPWDVIQAARGAAVCQRRDGCDRAALFALITTDTFLDSRVRCCRKRLGFHFESNHARGRKSHRALFDLCVGTSSNDMTSLDVYWVCVCVCVALIRCIGSVHTVQTASLKPSANKRRHLKYEFIVRLHEMFHSVTMLTFFDRKIILLTGHVICSRVTDRSHLSPALGIFQA